MKRKLSLLFTVLMTVILAVCLFPLAVSAAETNEPNVSIDRYNLVFDDNVYLKYAVKFDGVADSAITADNIGMLYFTSPQDEYTKENAAHSARVVGYVILDEQKYYTFENRKISAKNMTDYVYSVAYVELDGEIYYSAPNKYSVLEYAYSKLGKTGTASENEDYRNLLEATLTQGAMAQKYFGYNTERLANDEYYSVSVEGGTLEDGFAFGLYHTGETATLTAPETKENLIFSGWIDADGNLVSSENPLVLTNFDANKTYVASYAPKYSEGLKFVSNGDGTCYVAGIGTC